MNKPNTITAPVREVRPGKWQAVAHFDDQPTDYTCMHNHKTERLAAKCVGGVTAHWRRWWENAVSVTEVESGLMELESRNQLGNTVWVRFRMMGADR